MVEGAARLTELFPAWEERWDMKNSATRSFLGDHASVLLIWIMAVIFMLPRLVADAHWGSDALVGGAFLSLLGLAWVCFTPFTYQASEWLEKLTQPLTRLLARLPLQDRLSAISGR